MNKNVTVILSAYKRFHCLTEQYNSIQNQTIKPNEILLWQNKSEFSNKFDTDSLHNVKHTNSNDNFGVWSRFAHALNSKSKYVCIFDDDTIPGTKFIENCVNSFEQKNGLYGTIGLIYKSSETYLGAQRVGWDGINNENTTQVDIVGHSWFFEREMLSTFWRELPDINDFYVGEDMHFSHMLQKYTDLKTYVPPHPIHDKEMWGSLKGWEYGGDNHATANFAVPIMDEYYKKIVNKGFKIINS
jgi:hypothetical protein